MENKIIKFFSSRVILLLAPFLIFISTYLNYYLASEKYDYIMPMAALYKYYLLFFVILVGYYLLLSIISKNKEFSWFAAVAISLAIFNFTSVKQLVIALVIGLVFVLILRKIKLKEGAIFIVLPNIFVCFFFLFSFIPVSIRWLDLVINTNRTNADYTVVVDDSKTMKPNIYYIHCDGMMSMEAMNKYFNYDSPYLNDYLSKEDFIINRNVVLPLGHRTEKTLVALFNPYYYDNKGKAYYDDLDNYFAGKAKKVKNYITYNEITNKRMNSELLQGLSSGGYTTYGIGFYNQHTSINSDYYYYYNYYGGEENHLGKHLSLHLIDKSIKKKDLERFINMQVLGAIYPSPNVIEKIDYNDYLKKAKEISTENLDLEEYDYLKTTTNEKVKMMVASLHDIYNTDNSRFVFLDYDLNHLNISYYEDGSEQDDQGDFVDSYKQNYTYLSYLLVDLIKYIKTNDPNSVIVLQGDHGIHLLSCNRMIKSIGVEEQDCPIIRDSAISAIYIPKEYRLGDEEYLSNPLNISRYIINNYVGKNYEYIK